MHTPPALQACGLHHHWRTHTVLQGVDLALWHGEVVALLGANGAGKSTLLKLLLGLLSPAAGQVVLQGRPLGQWPRQQRAQALAYVPQVHVVPFPYTVREVVMLGRLPHSGWGRAPSAADHAAVARVLDRLGIAHLAARPYGEISGGERQLTLIARALAQGARMLVMDEPATGLDYGNQQRLLALQRELAAEGYGVLTTTHHPEHVLAGADRVAVLSAGRIVADDAPARALTPALMRELYGVDIEYVPMPDGPPLLRPRAPSPSLPRQRHRFPPHPPQSTRSHT